MGLFLTRQAGKRGNLGIWHITESLEELLALKKFSHEDLSVLGSFSYEHRKKEWLVSRILLEDLTGDKSLEIIYDEFNKPFLKGSARQISISHSHGLLALITDDRETGIDIERIKPNVLKIKERFMSDAEMKALEKGHKAEELTLYWCVKEALYKLYGKKELTFRKDLLVEPFEFLGKGNIRADILHESMKRKYILHYEKINAAKTEYMLAYVVHEG